MIYLDLFIGFLKVGLFAFGGAYGAIPLIRDVVLSYGWIGDEMLTYMIAVSESTPGPIMVNLATYIGSTQAGIPGAVVATLAVVLPAFGIILGLMAVLRRFVENPWVRALLTGLKACVAGLILATALEMLAANCLPGWTPDWTALALTAGLAALYFGFKPLFHKKLSPIALIVIAAVLGMAVYGV